MSFFSKLRERLFKSSSKIEDGLEDIIEKNSSDPSRLRSEDELSRMDLASPSESVNYGVESIDTSSNPRDQENESEQDSNYDEPKKGKDFSETAIKKTSGIFGEIIDKVENITRRRVIDEEVLERLEELLISADMGVKTATKITGSISERRFGNSVSVEDVRQMIAKEIFQIIEPVSTPLPFFPNELQVILVVGVNGSGKTTTIGKLAHQFKSSGKSVSIVAADTFRAAAVEQLEIWGARADVPVFTAENGRDPASLAFEAITEAENKKIDIVLIDTAGRLQNKTDLMEELSKLVRVVKKKDQNAPHNTLLVLDASTGQNAITQVEMFQKTANISGLIMTKLDGTAKGGILVSLADRFKLPIHAIGIGEQINDLQPFEPKDFAIALTGAKNKADL